MFSNESFFTLPAPYLCVRTGHLLQAYGGPSGQIHQRYLTEAQEPAYLHPDLFRNIIVQNITEQSADFGFKKRFCGVR